MPASPPNGAPAPDRARWKPLTVRSLLCVVLAGAALLLGGCDGPDDEPPIPKASGPTIETTKGTATPYGTGAGQVWVLRPRAGKIESVVVYLHGYGAYLPFEWHLQWMDHLLENGSAVIFPRYQAGSDDAFVVTPIDLEEGLRTGFRALRYDGEPVVTAGFSLGATLAFVYAARAAEWEVPAPRAVYSIFPVDPILVDLEFDLSTLDRGEALVLVGDNDDVVGQDGGKELMKMLTGLPAARKELRVIRASGELPSYHDAPTLVDRPVVRETFWTPLDDLVEQARAG
jgi:acetyl esterase/lipase